MVRLFDLLILLYPAEYRAKFGDEMRSVFLKLRNSHDRESWLSVLGFVWIECLSLVRGAASEQRSARASWQTAASMSGGALVAWGMHLVMYWTLVPVASGQGMPKQDTATLELAKSIYARSFTALRAAKTLDDLKKLSDDLDSPDWISVDRFGRTILTRKDAERELESMLALPPERRVTEMDIFWAERDSDRLTVVAWMMPNVSERIDSDGDFGPKDAKHRLMRGTLVRDIFQDTDKGWRRIRHDKLVPNDTVLAVDGKPRIVPPLDERNRVTPLK
jgi:hypothetical protein